MVNSMTGFSSYVYEDDDVKISIDLKSVNNKYLDIHLSLASDFDFLEEAILKAIRSKIKRGRVNVKVAIDIYQGQSLQLNEERLRDRVRVLERIIDNYDLESRLSLDSIIRDDKVIVELPMQVEKKDLECKLDKAIEEALKSLVDSRKREGASLKKDLVLLVDDLSVSLDKISSRAPLVKEIYRERLEEKVGDLASLDDDYIEDRLASEVLIYAERSDIREEIVRLKSHISLFKESLDTDYPVGKKLDFICQEFIRESNTIGSKANDKEIATQVIEMKVIIDKIREQVQNIE